MFLIFMYAMPVVERIVVITRLPWIEVQRFTHMVETCVSIEGKIER